MNVPFFRPEIGDQEKSAVNAVLESGWLTTGQWARDFEKKFATYLNVPHAVAVNSCTAALHLGLEACGLERDDIVLVPAMTFAATAEVVRYFGARPVLVDCEPSTLCVDPEAMLAAAEFWSRQGRLRAMIPMHYGGQMADMTRLTDIARRFDMHVIEDAAHALPAWTRTGPEGSWKSVGQTSPVTCFSFYANKCITTGEGGMLVTQDERIAERARMMSLHGLSKSAWSRFDTRGSWSYEIVEAGFKYNMTDMAAALGVAQLVKADRFWQQRRMVAARYAERLSQFAEFLECPTEQPDRRSAWHLYPIRLKLENLGLDRARFVEELKERGITCSVHWMPLHLHPYYRRTYDYRPGDFPVASTEWERLVSLPIFPLMTEEEIDYVADSIGAVVGAHARLREEMVCA